MISLAGSVPASPLNFVSTGATDTTIALTWDAVQNNTIPVTAYTVYYSVPEGEESSVSAGATTTLTLSSLQTKVNYNLYVTATNAVGEGARSDLLIVNTQSSEVDVGAWITANPWLMVAICCGSAAVLIVLILIGCIIRRRYQRKKDEKENFQENQYGLEEVDNVYGFRSESGSNPY